MSKEVKLQDIKILKFSGFTKNHDNAPYIAKKIARAKEVLSKAPIPEFKKN